MCHVLIAAPAPNGFASLKRNLQLLRVGLPLLPWETATTGCQAIIMRVLRPALPTHFKKTGSSKVQSDRA